MRTLLILIIGAAIGVGAYIYFREPGHRPEMNRAGERISEGAGQVRDTLQQKVGDIDTQQIKDELERTGRVVQKKAQEAGTAIADAASDARITAAIKSKFAVDPEVSAMTISVNTTRGVVTLAG